MRDVAVVGQQASVGGTLTVFVEVMMHWGAAPQFVRVGHPEEPLAMFFLMRRKDGRGGRHTTCTRETFSG